MQLNVLDDLAEAMKALDGKEILKHGIAIVRINLKTRLDVPLLGTVIEQNGNGCLEDSLMPVGWPLHLDGAV